MIVISTSSEEDGEGGDIKKKNKKPGFIIFNPSTNPFKFALVPTMKFMTYGQLQFASVLL